MSALNYATVLDVDFVNSPRSCVMAAQYNPNICSSSRSSKETAVNYEQINCGTKDSYGLMRMISATLQVKTSLLSSVTKLHTQIITTASADDAIDYTIMLCYYRSATQIISSL